MSTAKKFIPEQVKQQALDEYLRTRTEIGVTLETISEKYGLSRSLLHRLVSRVEEHKVAPGTEDSLNKELVATHKVINLLAGFNLPTQVRIVQYALDYKHEQSIVQTEKTETGTSGYA